MAKKYPNAIEIGSVTTKEEVGGVSSFKEAVERGVKLSIGGGSGQSVSSFTQIPSNALTEKLEAQKKAEEAKKAQEAAQAQQEARQEKIKSGTISGQISKVSAYNGEPSPGYSQSGLESFKQSIKNIANVKRIGEDGASSYISGIFSPFQYSYQEAKIGRYTPKQVELLKEYNVSTPFATGEVISEYEPGISEAELKRKIIEKKTREYKGKYEEGFSQIQSQIDTGEITLEEGEKKLEAYGNLLEGFYTKELSKSVSPITSTGSKIVQTGPRLIETGALIGTSFAGPVSIAIASGYLIGKGQKELGKGILGTDLTIGERTKSLAIGGLYTGAGVYGFSSSLGMIRQDILSGEIKEAFGRDFGLRPRVSYGTRERLDGGLVKEESFFYENVGGARMYGRAGTLSKQIGDNKFIFAGKQKIIFSTTEFGTGREILIGTGGKIGGVGFNLPEVGGYTPGVVYSKYGTTYDFLIKETGKQVSYGSGLIKARIGENVNYNINVYTTPYNIKEGLSGGIFAKKGDFIYGASGNIKEVRFAFGGGTGYRFDVENLVKLREIEQPDIIKSFTKSSVSTGQTSKLSTIYSPQLFKQSADRLLSVTGKQISGQAKAFVVSGRSAIFGGGAVNILNVREKEKSLVASSQFPRSSEKISNLYRNNLRYINKLSSGQKVSQLQRQGLTERTLQIQKLVQQPVSIAQNIPTQKPTIPQLPYATTFGFFIPPLKLPFGSGIKKQKKSQIKRQFTAYQPSFTGSVLNIRLSEVPLFGGSFQVRGIIEPRKKRVKRRKII